ncbi:hypothetical protein GCM10017559_71150 [Streptosporangium longisporum]|uniref:Protein kinase domain-containing protein n=1 Tax=Streptosporangium longisporum TaxID=46187 RepID=A0ABP6L604_9ACTN
MSPEQINKEHIDGRCDQYGLACVVYEALSGRLPFQRDNEIALLWAHLAETPTPLTTLPPRALPPQVGRGHDAGPGQVPPSSATRLRPVSSRSCVTRSAAPTSRTGSPQARPSRRRRPLRDAQARHRGPPAARAS